MCSFFHCAILLHMVCTILLLLQKRRIYFLVLLLGTESLYMLMFFISRAALYILGRTKLNLSRPGQFLTTIEERFPSSRARIYLDG
jgi:hypothetical protein